MDTTVVGLFQALSQSHREYTLSVHLVGHGPTMTFLGTSHERLPVYYCPLLHAAPGIWYDSVSKSVLVVYCCITILLQTQWQHTFISSQFLWVRSPELLSWVTCFRVLQGCGQGVNWACSPYVRVSWGGVTSRPVGLVAAFTFLWVVEWRPQVLAGCCLRPPSFPYVCSNYITARLLASLLAKWEWASYTI